LAAAVLEVLALVHMNRSVGHLAAIESQSQKAKKYVQDFLQKSLLKDFLVGDSKRNIVLARYFDEAAGDNYTEKEWKKLPPTLRDRCKKITHDLEILICTIKGANSAHVPFMCVDGKTTILAKTDTNTATNRSRKRLTARGIFCQLAGLKTGGNPNKINEYNLDISDPQKKIEVLTFNFDTGKLEYKPILRGHRRKEECIEIECSDGRKITVTNDHPVYVINKGFTRGKDLSIGDGLFTIKRKAPHTSAIESIKGVGTRTVFDFTVADNHNFFGNHILNKNCLDELDVADPASVMEASMIPSSSEGKKPISVLISTRKTAFGLVQKELDEAHKSGLHVRHWNIIDATESCSIDRRKNEELNVDLYINDEDLSHTTKQKYEQLDDKQKEKYRHKKGYEGCVKCPLFSMCEGQLGYKQRNNPNTLRPISDVVSTFKKLSTEAAQAQLMCRMPESAGLVFSRFDRENHMISAEQMATIVSGEDPHPVSDKGTLINFFTKKGLRFFAGIDWGYNHDFSVISGALFGESIFVFDVISMPGLDPEDKVTYAQPIKKWSPIIFADTEAPDNIALFRKRGFIMRTWNKGRGSLREGIEAVRSRLWDKETGCERLAEDLSKYHYKLDSAGNPTDTPNDKNDDRVDAFRYLILNAFKNTTITSIIDPVKNQDEIYFDKPTTQNFVQYFIDQALGNTDVDDISKEGPMRGSDPTGVSWDME
jgi:hypothetical protein